MPPKTLNNQEMRLTLIERIHHNARYALGIGVDKLTNLEAFEAIALTLRENLIDGMLDTEARYTGQGAKRLYYLSMEFLMGRALGNGLYNLGLLEICRSALSDMGIDLEEVRQAEPERRWETVAWAVWPPVFWIPLASLGLAGYGYGLLYEFGLFRQEIRNGYQTEKPDHWNALGSPWLIERPEEASIVPIYGRIENGLDAAGSYNPMWLDWKVLVGVPFDLPVPGYGGHTINFSTALFGSFVAGFRHANIQ